MPSPQIKSPLNDSILFVCKSSPAEGITHAGRRTKSSRIHLPFRAHKQYGAKREPARLRGSPPPPRWARLCPGVARTTQSAAPRLGARKMLEILSRGSARRKLQGELQEIRCRAVEGQNGWELGGFWFSPNAGRGDALCWRGQSRAGGLLI